jgi:MinD superfamily P-loop ATPase
VVKCWPCSVFARYTLAFAFQLRKKHGKPSVGVVEKCPDIPVAAVQYRFTHKQYREYRKRNIHNNKKKKKCVKCGPCPRLCEFYAGICFTTEEKVWKTPQLG